MCDKLQLTYDDDDWMWTSRVKSKDDNEVRMRIKKTPIER